MVRPTRQKDLSNLKVISCRSQISPMRFLRSQAGNLAARHGFVSVSTPERTRAGMDHRPTIRSNLDAMDFADRNGVGCEGR